MKFKLNNSPYTSIRFNKKFNYNFGADKFLDFSNSRNWNGGVTLPFSGPEKISFQNCNLFNALINFPNGVKDLSYCFYGCTNFNQNLIIPDGVTNVDNILTGATKFYSNFYVPNSLNFLSANIGSFNAREFCLDLNGAGNYFFKTNLFGGTHLTKRININNTFDLKLSDSFTNNPGGNLFLNTYLSNFMAFSNNELYYRHTNLEFTAKNIFFTIFGNYANYGNYINNGVANSSWGTSVVINFSGRNSISIHNNFKNFYRNMNDFNYPLVLPTKIVDMSCMLYGCYNFNQSISINDTVTNLNSTFVNCRNFNQPLSIPGSVINVNYMLSDCWNFNQLVTFQGQSVIDMTGMFNNCGNFNQPLNIPNSVIYLNNLFVTARAFNQPITIPENVKYAYNLLYYCRNFNSEINFLSNDIYLGSMIDSCQNFNQSIHAPNYFAIRNCIIFNAPIFSYNGVSILNCPNYNENITILKHPNDSNKFVNISLINLPLFNRSIDMDPSLISSIYHFANDCPQFNQPVKVILNASRYDNYAYFPIHNCPNFNSPVDIYLTAYTSTASQTYSTNNDIYYNFNNFMGNHIQVINYLSFYPINYPISFITDDHIVNFSYGLYNINNLNIPINLPEYVIHRGFTNAFANCTNMNQTINITPSMLIGIGDYSFYLCQRMTLNVPDILDRYLNSYELQILRGNTRSLVYYSTNNVYSNYYGFVDIDTNQVVYSWNNMLLTRDDYYKRVYINFNSLNNLAGKNLLYRVIDYAHPEIQIQGGNNTLVNTNFKIDISHAKYSLAGMLSELPNFNQPVEVPEAVINIDKMLCNDYNFNAPVTISNNVKSMRGCFTFCYNFNQPLYIPAGVKWAEGMLSQTTNFNSNITIAANSNLHNQGFRMLAGATGFNANIIFEDSETKLIGNQFFSGCHSFNQPVDFNRFGGYLHSLENMFSYCNNFNQEINLSSAQDIVKIDNMLSNTPKFNQNIILGSYVNSWNNFLYNCGFINNPKLSLSYSGKNGFKISELGCGTSKYNHYTNIIGCENAYSMFNDCFLFNKPIDVSTVVDGSYMFQGCSNFNQPVNFSNANSMIGTFLNCFNFNAEIKFPNRYVYMSTYTFKNMYKFNRPISGIIYVNMVPGVTNRSIDLMSWSNYNHPLNFSYKMTTNNMSPCIYLPPNFNSTLNMNGIVPKAFNSSYTNNIYIYNANVTELFNGFTFNLNNVKLYIYNSCGVMNNTYANLSSFSGSLFIGQSSDYDNPYPSYFAEYPLHKRINFIHTFDNTSSFTNISIINPCGDFNYTFANSNFNKDINLDGVGSMEGAFYNSNFNRDLYINSAYDISYMLYNTKNYKRNIYIRSNANSMNMRYAFSYSNVRNIYIYTNKPFNFYYAGLSTVNSFAKYIHINKELNANPTSGSIYLNRSFLASNNSFMNITFTSKNNYCYYNATYNYFICNDL